MFIAGLLHNLGELLCLKLFADLRADAPAEGLLDELAPEIERVHEDFGMALARSWNLPMSLVRIIGYHHRPRPGASTDESVVRHLILAASKMALKAGFQYLPNQSGADPVPDLKKLGLAEADVAQLYVEAATWTT
jgi:HD-like signal output (HDOD) protein